MALTPDVLHSPPSLVGLDSAADAGLAEGLAALESYKKKDSAKGQHPLACYLDMSRLRDKSLVVVRFKAVGNAPIMKQNFFRVTVSNRFQAVIQFLRKELGWKAGEPLVGAFLLAQALSVLNELFCLVHVYQSCVFPCTRRYDCEFISRESFYPHISSSSSRQTQVICYGRTSYCKL